MPRNTNPGGLRVGPGKESSKGTPDLDLTGAGMAGPGPNIGQGNAPPFLADAGPTPVGIDASMVVTDPFPGLIGSSNVEGALDELIGVIPQRPPFVGEISPQLSVGGAPAAFTFSGAPDWGILKLADNDLQSKGALTSTNAAADVFPYYHTYPSPALDTPDFDTSPGLGGDPATDPQFNSDVPVGATYPGSGPGTVYAGAFTRLPGGAGPVVRTDRIMTRTAVIDGLTLLPEQQQVVVSGCLYPADRGVLALIHWPADGGVVEFLAQPLLDRCIAAILLGQGVTQIPAPGCDGQEGGIFAVGINADGQYDPFAFPGRATGQYDLGEIADGVSDLDGSPLNPPFDDLDGDLAAGWKRASGVDIQGPGQVRLGSDPNAGVATETFGIPILGAPLRVYSPAPVAGTLIGNSVMTADGAGNIFGYRLPYLNDYSPTTGLKYTPRGQDALTTRETARYFAQGTVNADFPAAVPLVTAGNYTAFERDYWVWQVARYRHTFVLPSTAAVGAPEDAGSYFLIHFKREGDFEKLVRDGILPDDAVDGYETYSVGLVAPGGTPEGTVNVVNEFAGVATPPEGEAPDYGYRALAHHGARVSVYLDPEGDTVTAGGTVATYDWISGSTGGAEHVQWISGVAYFAPRDPAAAPVSFEFTGLSTVLTGFWDYSYRTDHLDLAAGAVAPAQLASPDPAFVGLAPYSYNLTSGTQTYTMNALTTPATHQYAGRAEFPYTFLGSNGFGVFAPANGPQPGDDLEITLLGGNLEFTGDLTEPSFTQDAQVRTYFRKPGAHTTPDLTVQPFAAADGHGVVHTPSPAATILYHSSAFSSVGSLEPRYGNFQITPGGVITEAQGHFDKDTHERFLDETHRWRSDWDVALGAAVQTYLVGPGMTGYAAGPISVPLIAGAAQAPYAVASYLQATLNQDTLEDGNPQDIELQVVGLPDRNPPLSEGVARPFPSTGLLAYPQKNFLVGHRPSLAAGEIAAAQRDYSTATGTRSFVRTLDVSFTQSGTRETVNGQPFLHLRVDGLSLRDFAYTAPGPGGLNTASGIALFLKVPGLTTWLDLGRRDGDGPSKQDAALDGAGCQVTGVETFDTVDPITGVVYCQIRVHVGPVANLFDVAVNHDFENFAGAVTNALAYTPVLLKVSMAATALSYNLEEEYTGVAGGFGGVVEPGLPWGSVRGLVGIRVVRESAVEIAP